MEVLRARMKKILLANGKGEALVDDSDYEELSKFKWHLSGGYAQRSYGTRATRKSIRLHNCILPRRAGWQIDHINRNRVDNRRENLRYATNQQNCWNTTARRNSRTGSKGVSWRPEKNKFRAVIEHAGKQIFLGHFDSIEAASGARAKMELELRGDFAPAA